jgi:hypothetical protein
VSHDGDRPPGARHAGFTFDDFDAQLTGQEAGLNKLNVGEWQRNRERYIERSEEGESGRDPIADKYQEKFREKQEGLLTATLRPPRGSAVDGRPDPTRLRAGGRGLAAAARPPAWCQ